MSDISKFLIVGMQRSGTTVTHASVRPHPEVRAALDEVLADPTFTRGLASFLVSGRESYGARDRGMRMLFDSLADLQPEDSAPDSAIRAAGLKTAVGKYQTALSLHATLIEHFPSMKVVIVERRDLVAQFGSNLRAQKTGVWHSRGSRAEHEQVQLKLPVAEFEAYARIAVRIYAAWDRIAETHETLRVVYEDHIDGGFQHDRLFDFLGIQRVAPTWLKMNKVSPPPEDYIENYDELRARQRTIESSERFDVEADFLDHLAEIARDDDDVLLIERAKSRLTQGLNSEARTDVRELLGRHGSLPSRRAGVVQALGVIAGLENEIENDTFARFADDPSFHHQNANTWREAGRTREALAAIVRSVACSETVEPGWISLIRTLSRELTDDQIEAASQEFAADESSKGNLAALALLAASKGDKPRALAMLARVRDRDADLGGILEPMLR